ncbi:hypothetical protein H4R27_005581, partial [Coemansia aciculifera]
MVSYQANQLEATNVTLQYVANDDTVYNLSFSRNDLEAHGNDVSKLVDLLKKGSAEWIKELYTGSDYIQDAIATYSLAMGHFTVTVSHIQGGYGKMIPDYYEVETATEDETKYLVGYNNSRFDNFILLKHSLKNNDYVGHARFAGNTIVSASINGFVVRDLCRILNMSLDNACKAFKIELPKLTGAVKHHEVQMKFMDGKREFAEYLVQMQNTISQYV